MAESLSIPTLEPAASAAGQNRLGQIKSLQAQSREQASRQTAAQQASTAAQFRDKLGAAAQTPGASVTPQQSGELAAAVAAATGKSANEAQAGQVQQAQQLAGFAQNEVQMTRQAALAQRSSQNNAAKEELKARLSQLGEYAENTIFQDNLKFERDELGRTLFNERQLADYALAHLRTQEEWSDYEQNLQQLTERKLTMMRQAEQRITQALAQEMQKDEQNQNQALKQRLYEAKAELEKKTREAQASARNRASMFNAVGTIAGTVIGGALGSVVPGAGTAVGAAVGASIGGSLGGGAGSLLGAATADNTPIQAPKV